MKRVLLLIVLILLTGGCKVEYNLTIDDDLSVLENVNMTGTEALFDIYYKSSKLNVINMLLDVDKDTLENNGYNYKIVEDTTPYVLADKEYNDVNSFVDNTIFYKQYFDNLEYKNKNGVITISTNNFKPNDSDDPNRFDISNLTIAITSKFKVVKHNADDVSQNTNTYYWHINRSTENFELLLSFDSNIKFNPNINTYIIIIVSVLIIIITWLIIWCYDRKDKKKKRKINKLTCDIII